MGIPECPALELKKSNRHEQGRYMEPVETGKKYNKISEIYQSELLNSNYGLAQVKRAISFVNVTGSALDVGCGVGGRIVDELEISGFVITGIDVSRSMVTLAQESHPKVHFEIADICSWQTQQSFDFVVAWDSLFHLPLSQHEVVLKKLCSLLTSGGVLIYTFGNDIGEHISNWHNDTFYYSSIGLNRNLQVLIDSGLDVMHMELDQYPEKHVYVVAKKP